MKQYVVDAFTDTLFKGNPAAICVLERWLPETLMMSIALENNFSETAFAVKEGESYRLRWFTPGGEIDLCGHATLQMRRCGGCGLWLRPLSHCSLLGQPPGKT